MKYNRIYVAKRLAKHVTVPVRFVTLMQIISVISMLLSLISPYLYSQLVDEVMQNGKTELLYTIVLAMIGVFIVGCILSAISTVISVRYKNKVDLGTKTKLFNQFIYKEIANVEKIDVGEEQKIIEQDAGVVSGFFSGQIVGFFASYVFAAIFFILMLIISPWLSLAAAVFIPLTIIFGRYTGKKYNIINKQLWETSAKNNSFLLDTIQKWREIKAQNLEQSLKEQYTEKLHPECQTLLTWIKCYGLNNVFYDIKEMFVNNVLMYFLGGLLIVGNQLTIGTLLMFMSYMTSFSSYIDSIIGSITAFSGDKAIYDRLFKALEYKKPIKKPIVETELDIKISDLTFSYNENLPCILSNVSYEFEHGKKYLIVGKSGEGKSTLIKLLLCLNSPNDGSIRLGETDLRVIDQQSLFTNLTAVMQENNFFNLSIRDNFQMVVPEATEEQIDSACKSADIYDFIMSLPDKYETIIGERGIKLSGGQKQRLAIARLILHAPQIAIFDEATSSLDAITETNILNNLNDIFAAKTLIFISHKPALQIKFDEVLRIKNTAIVSMKEQSK